MANALFASARESYLLGDLDWDLDDIRTVLIDEGTDTPVPATDDFLDDIATGIVSSLSAGLGSKTTTGGTADAADAVHSSVSGATIESIVGYKHTGTNSTSNLIWYMDTDTGGAISVTPTGGDITISWNPSGIFTL